MTVSTTVNKIIFTADGATTVFAFSFPVILASNLQVFFTDLNGVITQQFTGFTVQLNSATSINPSQAGGSVTFSVAPTSGFKVTLYRSLSLTQQTSLANQGTLYQPVEEAALDYGVMLSQQVLEVQSRALVVAVSDPAPLALPPVAQRANLGMGFDSNGNPIAISLAPAGTISSAMAPVVSAASLSAGRTALGLGAAAQEGIGGGLQDDGAGNLRTFFNTVADSGNTSVTSAFHSNIRAATGSFTYTLPKASTLFNGFGFWVYALTGSITLAINAADAFSGMGTGVSLVIPAGARVFVSTDATSTWFVRNWLFQGHNAPLNCSLSASVAASALTIALKDSNGNDPSPSSPVFFTVQNASGGLVQRAVTTPLSITVPSGATLGTVNGQASRIWVHLYDNAGTPVLGVYNSLNSSGPSVLGWDETTTQTTTNISAGSTLSQTHYTNGALASKFFCPLGFVESTQPTAGTWSVSPSKVGLFGPGVKRPGDTIQETISAIAGADTINSATFIALANNRITISLQYSGNLLRVEAAGPLTAPGPTGTGQTTSASVQLSLGTVNNSGLFGPLQINSLGLAGAGASQGSQINPSFIYGYSLPNAASATYAVQGKASGGTGTGFYGGGTVMSAKEIMV